MLSITSTPIENDKCGERKRGRSKRCVYSLGLGDAVTVAGK